MAANVRSKIPHIEKHIITAMETLQRDRRYMQKLNQTMKSRGVQKNGNGTGKLAPKNRGLLSSLTRNGRPHRAMPSTRRFHDFTLALVELNRATHPEEIIRPHKTQSNDAGNNIRLDSFPASPRNVRLHVNRVGVTQTLKR